MKLKSVVVVIALSANGGMNNEDAIFSTMTQVVGKKIESCCGCDGEEENSDSCGDEKNIKTESCCGCEGEEESNTSCGDENKPCGEGEGITPSQATGITPVTKTTDDFVSKISTALENWGNEYFVTGEENVEYGAFCTWNIVNILMPKTVSELFEYQQVVSTFLQNTSQLFETTSKIIFEAKVQLEKNTSNTSKNTLSYTENVMTGLRSSVNGYFLNGHQYLVFAAKKAASVYSSSSLTTKERENVTGMFEAIAKFITNASSINGNLVSSYNETMHKFNETMRDVPSNLFGKMETDVNENITLEVLENYSPLELKKILLRVHDLVSIDESSLEKLVGDDFSAQIKYFPTVSKIIFNEYISSTNYDVVTPKLDNLTKLIQTAAKLSRKATDFSNIENFSSLAYALDSAELNTFVSQLSAVVVDVLEIVLKDADIAKAIFGQLNKWLASGDIDESGDNDRHTSDFYANGDSNFLRVGQDALNSLLASVIRDSDSIIIRDSTFWSMFTANLKEMVSGFEDKSVNHNFALTDIAELLSLFAAEFSVFGNFIADPQQNHKIAGANSTNLAGTQNGVVFKKSVENMMSKLEKRKSEMSSNTTAASSTNHSDLKSVVFLAFHKYIFDGFYDKACKTSDSIESGVSNPMHLFLNACVKGFFSSFRGAVGNVVALNDHVSENADVPKSDARKSVASIRSIDESVSASPVMTVRSSQRFRGSHGQGVL